MKILYFSFVELDVPNACRTHTLGVLRGFGHHGCKVNALVPKPTSCRPTIENVHFHFLWPWQFSTIGQFWIKLLSFLIMSMLCLKKKFDAIYVRELEQNPAPRLCSKIFKIPLYIEINDLIAFSLKERNDSYNRMKKVVNCQKADFKQSNGLIVPSVPMKKALIKKHGLPKNKVHMILNGSEKLDNCNLDPTQSRKELDLPLDCFCMVFLGNIYEVYDFTVILKAMAVCQMRIPDIRLLIIGDGPLVNKIKRKAGELKLEKKINFMGYIPYEQLGKILPAADVGLLIRTKESTEKYGPVATKFSTYALYQLPVISSGFSLKGYQSELDQNIYLVPPEDHNALSDKIYELYNNPKDRKEKAKILYKYVSEKLTWNAVTEDILEIINQDINVQ